MRAETRHQLARAKARAFHRYHVVWGLDHEDAWYQSVRSTDRVRKSFKKDPTPKISNSRAPSPEEFVAPEIVAPEDMNRTFTCEFSWFNRL